MDHTATYSPDDNKLRLYPACRLDKEEYQRFRDAGFRWAPKQELFFAPAWTPEREDLLNEFCPDGIGDEDKSLSERAEERAERFEDYSDKRGQDAERARKGVAAICDKIPLGQPILVGHHSERHARRDAKRIENGMRKAVQLWETSEYWKTRAASAIRHARYLERPDVRARRIKKLEAEKRGVERTAKHARLVLKFWRGELMAKRKGETESKPVEVTRESALWFCNRYDQTSHKFTLAEYPRTVHTYEGYISLWSAIGGNINGEEPEAAAIISVEEAKRISTEAHERSLARCERWIAHYDNRLAYERAMLDDAGGIEADKNDGPEKGGACKCWASRRGAWSYIQKRNKVSVTVLDNWGNGGANFTRNIPFDKLSAVMTADEVEQARSRGDLRELDDKTGFCLVSDFKPKAPATEPTKPEPEPAVQTVTDVEAKAQFQAMREAVEKGVQVVTANQLFPTPVDLCERMADLADLCAGDRVLEPSAGTGNLLQAIKMRGIFAEDLQGIEINTDLANRLKCQGFNVRCADFLECEDETGFDKVLMNPPFQNAEDIKHIEHARRLLRPGGKLVAICANGPRQNDKLQPIADSWEELPEKTFNGTGVRAVILTISRPEEPEPIRIHMDKACFVPGEGIQPISPATVAPAIVQSELF